MLSGDEWLEKKKKKTQPQPKNPNKILNNN